MGNWTVKGSITNFWHYYKVHFLTVYLSVPGKIYESVNLSGLLCH